MDVIEPKQSMTSTGLDVNNCISVHVTKFVSVKRKKNLSNNQNKAAEKMVIFLKLILVECYDMETQTDIGTDISGEE